MPWRFTPFFFPLWCFRTPKQINDSGAVVRTEENIFSTIPLPSTHIHDIQSYSRSPIRQIGPPDRYQSLSPVRHRDESPSSPYVSLQSSSRLGTSTSSLSSQPFPDVRRFSSSNSKSREFYRERIQRGTGVMRALSPEK